MLNLAIMLVAVCFASKLLLLKQSDPCLAASSCCLMTLFVGPCCQANSACTITIVNDFCLTQLPSRVGRQPCTPTTVNLKEHAHLFSPSAVRAIAVCMCPYDGEAVHMEFERNHNQFGGHSTVTPPLCYGTSITFALFLMLHTCVFTPCCIGTAMNLSLPSQVPAVW